MREAATELFRGRVTLALQTCPTAVDELTPVARGALLNPAVPNPFNPSTELAFELPGAQNVRLAIFDLQGREVAELASGHHAAGSHSVVWGGRDDSGRAVPAGIYLARLEAGGEVATQKVALIK